MVREYGNTVSRNYLRLVGNFLDVFEIINE